MQKNRKTVKVKSVTIQEAAEEFFRSNKAKGLAEATCNAESSIQDNSDEKQTDSVKPADPADAESSETEKASGTAKSGSRGRKGKLKGIGSSTRQKKDSSVESADDNSMADKPDLKTDRSGASRDDANDTTDTPATDSDKSGVSQEPKSGVPSSTGSDREEKPISDDTAA